MFGWFDQLGQIFLRCRYVRASCRTGGPVRSTFVRCSSSFHACLLGIGIEGIAIRRFVFTLRFKHFSFFFFIEKNAKTRNVSLSLSFSKRIVNSLNSHGIEVVSMHD